MYKVIIQNLDNLNENFETVCNDFIFAGSFEGEYETCQTDNVSERSLLIDKIEKEHRKDV